VEWNVFGQNGCKIFIKLKGRDPLGDLGVDGRIMLKWILNSADRCGMDSSYWAQGESVVVCCKHGNELSGSIKGKDFLTRWTLVSFSRTLLHEVSKLECLILCSLTVLWLACCCQRVHQDLWFICEIETKNRNYKTVFIVKIHYWKKSFSIKVTDCRGRNVAYFLMYHCLWAGKS